MMNTGGCGFPQLTVSHAAIGNLPLREPTQIARRRTTMFLGLTLLPAFLFCGLPGRTIAATTWHVDASVPQSGDGASWESAFWRIQEGIDAASPGDTVIVAPGTYSETIRFRGKDITVTSADPLDSAVVQKTVIDGGQAGAVVNFSGMENEASVLCGFTVRNGSGDDGGGISGGMLGAQTRATIRNNVIFPNTALRGGGLAYCDGMIRDNSICANSAQFGGGLFRCNGAIEGNVILGNSAPAASGAGGGLAFCGGIIEGNTIKDNSAQEGGGLYRCDGTILNNRINANRAGGFGGALALCHGVIENNTIYGNSAGEGGEGLYASGETIRNCIIWRNGRGSQILNCSVPRYSCIEGWSAVGEGNIAHYPYFVNPGSGDFHLKSWSPCIDSGDPSSPYSDEPEPNGGRINMGVYGNTPEATPASPDADLDGLPDDWELQFFGELAQGAAGDPDGDFISNIGEYRRGSSPAERGTCHVDSSAPASGDGALWETAFKTIQEGIDAASDRAVVAVAEGIYKENVHFRGTNIILTSTDPLDGEVVANTIIDGNSAGSVVTFEGTEDQTCVLSGFTIRNGMAPMGGAILGGTWMKMTGATIENNVITGNRADGETYGHGGGLAFCSGTIRNNAISQNFAAQDGGGLYYCQGVIRDNVISGNRALYGGGLHDCDRIIMNNVISANTARDGGGLAYSGGLIHNNVVVGNRADRNGGGFCFCGGAIRNNAIAGNAADRGGSLYGCNATLKNNTLLGNTGVLYACRGTVENCTICGNADGISGDSYVTARNCIIWGNRPDNWPGFSRPTYSCVEGWQGYDEGNIAKDPRFVDADGPDDDPMTYEDNDYRLRPDSPCIDAGFNDPESPETDIAGMHRIMFGGKSLTVDMGAYEFYINALTPGPEPHQTTFTWSSLADKSHSIFYSDDLLNWHTAIAAFPSSGNQTTFWIDDGSLTGLPPSLVPRRFYRILENP